LPATYCELFAIKMGPHLFILVASVLAAAATVHLGRLDKPHNLKLLTAFTGAYLMSLTCLHLLPEVFSNGHGGHSGPHWRIGAFVLGGFFMQVVLENFSRGLEHGHSHAPHGPLPFSMLAGLFLHAFLEATPLGASGHAAHAAGHDHNTTLLLAAIAIHKYPVAIVLLAMLLQSGISRRKAYGLLGVFAAMAPLGALAGGIPALAGHHHWLLAMVVGIFMHVATTILFESEEGHRVNLQKGIAIALGTVLAIGTIALPIH
jgi:zinc transporter ZupT